jgi:hypothetical protein
MMGLQLWISAVSVIVAASAFVFSIWTKRKADRDVELRNWQRVVIYSLIEETASISFEDLKSKYLQRAQQLLSHKVPKKEIQDDALRRILLDLQKDGVVIRLEDLNYKVQVKVPMEAWALEELKRQQIQRKLKPRVLTIVERESGVHTPETLVRRLHELGVNVSFEDLDDLLFELRGYPTVKKEPDGKLEFVPPYGEQAK